MLTSVLSLQSPFQMLFQTNPNYEKLKTFGCRCFSWLHPYVNNKLKPKSASCIFLGYFLTQSAYLCLEPVSHHIYMSHGMYSLMRKCSLSLHYKILCPHTPNKHLLLKPFNSYLSTLCHLLRSPVTLP